MRLSLIFALLLLSLTVTAAQGADAPRMGGSAATIAEQYLLSAANQERMARGLPELHRDPQLALAAAGHAQEMAAHEGISHQFAGEAKLTSRGASAGVAFSAISENVAQAPGVVEIHEMWMHSEHHRSNLLDPSIDSAGISVVERDGELYAVEDFAKTVRAVSLEQQEAAIGSLVRGRVALTSDAESVAAARGNCATSMSFAGARRPGFIMRFTSDSLERLPATLATKMASGKYREAAVGACASPGRGGFTLYSFAVLLYP